MNAQAQELYDDIKTALEKSEHGQVSDATAEALAVALVAQGWSK